MCIVRFVPDISKWLNLFKSPYPHNLLFITIVVFLSYILNNFYHSFILILAFFSIRLNCSTYPESLIISIYPQMILKFILLKFLGYQNIQSIYLYTFICKLYPTKAFKTNGSKSLLLTPIK